MREALTYVELNTCNCKFTIRYVFDDNSDTPATESLHSYKSKCETHGSLDDVQAFLAALDMARTINLGEDYIVEGTETIGE